MKNIRIFAVTVLMSSSLFAAAPEDSKIFTPYFDMSLTEAGYMPSNGNIFSGALIDTRAGFLANVAENHGIFLLYNFNYSGPAFHPQDSKQFTERTMDHGLNLEYRYKINEKFRVRPGLSLGKGYRRMGTNESWDNGLYNTNSKGGQLSFDYNFDIDRKGSLTFMTIYRKIEFPNYTDLLLEFQNPSAASEVGGGLQDQSFMQYSLRANWRNFFGGISFTNQNYKNQKVTLSDASYGNTKQKDTDTSLDFGMNHTLWIFELAPSLAYTVHGSNQNFIRYKSVGDTSFEFVKDAYSYKELSLNIPLDLNITGKWAVGGAIISTVRNYDSRWARDANNDYMKDKKQTNTMNTIMASIRKRINEVASVRLFYSITKAASNNKFEAYMPYNYTGNSFGLTYNISY